MLKHLKAGDIERIVALANRLKQQHPVTEHGIDPGEKHAVGPNLPDRRPLEQDIEALGFEARMELIALIEFGRGFEGSFDDAVFHAKEVTTAADVGYLSDDAPSLARDLGNGLARLVSSPAS